MSRISKSMERLRFYRDLSMDLRSELPSTILFIMSAASAIITHAKSYDYSTVMIYSVVKLNLPRLSVC